MKVQACHSLRVGHCPRCRWGRTFGCLVVLLLLVSGTGICQSEQRSDDALEYLLDRDVVTIPFLYRNHQILVTGALEGRDRLTFMLDTGASISVIDTEYHHLGTPLGRMRMREAHGETDTDAVRLPSIQLEGANGRVAVHNSVALVSDLSQMSHLLGCKLSGIIGIPLVAGFVVDIDYQQHVLRFHDKRTVDLSARSPDNQRTFLFGLVASNHTQDVPCQYMQGQIGVKYRYTFLLDTGFGGYLSVAHAAAEESGLLTAKTPTIPSTSYSLSRQFRTSKLRAQSLFLGAIDLTGKTITVDYRNGDVVGQQGIVGNRFLQNYYVTLDYPHHRLWLERAPGEEERDEADKPAFGMDLRLEPNGIYVYRVARHSPAHRSGVHAGDVILAINGQSLDKFIGTEALRLLNVPHGAVRLSVERAIDPNLGTTPGAVTVTMAPASPLDWAGL